MVFTYYFNVMSNTTKLTFKFNANITDKNKGS